MTISPARPAYRKPPAAIWRAWMRVATIGTAIFGLALTTVPGFATAMFGLMIYGDASGPPGIDGEAARYVAFIYAVLGAVMFGWGVSMAAIAHYSFARGERLGWLLLALPLLLWFLPDTAYSLLHGYWPNAVLNAAFLAILGIPLLATRTQFFKPSGE